MKKKVLVINYHRIDTGNNIEISDFDRIYTVLKSVFEGQIEILMKNGIPVIKLEDIVNDNVSAPFSVAITIDDGNLSDYEIIYPFLNKNNIRAAFFLLINNKINWDNVVEMSKQGFTIGSHGINHSDLTKLESREQQFELEFSKKIIEDKTNQKVDFFSFPFGMYNQKIIALGKAVGYKAVLTTDVKLNNPGRDSFLLHRWSVKRTTTLKEFESIVMNSYSLKRKILISNLKAIHRKILGSSITDKLNILHTKIKEHANDNN